MDDDSWRAKWNRLLEPPPQFEPEWLPFPTAAQLDLLKAALLPTEDAAAAWRRWKARGLHLETADDASTRMLPQLWANRIPAGVGSEDWMLLKGVYRKVLFSNTMRLSGALDTSELLVEAGIPAIFMKGAAINALCGDRLGLRRIDDVDLLVPEAETERAMAILRDAGFVERITYPAGPAIGVIHAWPFSGPGGAEIDLHWWVHKAAGDDSPVFATAREATLLGRRVLIPSATECLISAVVNGFGPGARGGAPMRWIGDAMLLFSIEADAIDWDELLDRAHRPGLTLALAAGLEFLAREFGAPVPAAVLTELRRRRISLRERAAHWSAINRPPVLTEVFDQAERHRARRLRYRTGVPRTFIGHMAQATGTSRGHIVHGLARSAAGWLIRPIVRRGRRRRRDLT